MLRLIRPSRSSDGRTEGPIDLLVNETDNFTRRGTQHIDNATWLMPDKVPEFRENLRKIDERTMKIREHQAKGGVTDQIRAFGLAAGGAIEGYLAKEKIKRTASNRRARAAMDNDEERRLRLEYNTSFGSKSSRAVLDSDSSDNAKLPRSSSYRPVLAYVPSGDGHSGDELDDADEAYSDAETSDSSITLQADASDGEDTEKPTRFFVANRNSVSTATQSISSATLTDFNPNLMIRSRPPQVLRPIESNDQMPSQLQPHPNPHHRRTPSAETTLKPSHPVPKLPVKSYTAPDLSPLQPKKNNVVQAPGVARRATAPAQSLQRTAPTSMQLREEVAPIVQQVRRAPNPRVNNNAKRLSSHSQNQDSSSDEMPDRSITPKPSSLTQSRKGKHRHAPPPAHAVPGRTAMKAPSQSSSHHHHIPTRPPTPERRARVVSPTSSDAVSPSGSTANSGATTPSSETLQDYFTMSPEEYSPTTSSIFLEKDDMVVPRSSPPVSRVARREVRTSSRTHSQQSPLPSSSPTDTSRVRHKYVRSRKRYSVGSGRTELPTFDYPEEPSMSKPDPDLGYDKLTGSSPTLMGIGHLLIIPPRGMPPPHPASRSRPQSPAPLGVSPYSGRSLSDPIPPVNVISPFSPEAYLAFYGSQLAQGYAMRPTPYIHYTL